MVNKILLANILQINSLTNGEGTGFMYFSKTGKASIYKTELAADTMLDLGIYIADKIQGDYPLLGHVRAASKGMEVTKANSHPFDGPRFVLAHNGRLYPKNEVVKYNNTVEDTGLASDSQKFLLELESDAEKFPKLPFLELVSTTMGRHKGKFALMIYDKKTKKFYVCRGNTADLYFTNLLEYPKGNGDPKIIGFVVNTRKASLMDSLCYATTAVQVITGRRISYEVAVELPKNTVFEVQGQELLEIGKMEETPVVFTYPSQAKTGNTGATIWETSKKYTVNTRLAIWDYSDKIFKFMVNHRLSISDIDFLIKMACGYSIADAALEDLDKFINVYIPKITAPKKVRERLHKITDDSFQIMPYMYTKIPGLQYPWSVSSMDSIQNLFKYIVESKKVIK